MDTIIAVIDSSITEMKAALQSLEENYTVHYFASVDDFFRVLDEFVAARDSDEELRDYEAKASLIPIDLLVIEADLIRHPPIQWMQETQKKFKDLNVSPQGDITKFIFTSFEKEGRNITAIQHHYLHDVVFKPLDQPLLLQKIEMISGLPKITSPGHLYSHKTAGEIDLSKEAQLCEISEFGMTLLNPSPIHPGIFANFRLPFPDENHTVKFIGRCYKCEPAEVPNYYKCSFSYFGISPSDMRHQRVLFQRLEQKRDNSNFEEESPTNLSGEAKALRIRQQILQRAKAGPAGKGSSAGTGSNLASDIDEVKAVIDKKDVVVIDMDRFNLEAIAHSFDQNFPNANLHIFPTMAYFAKKVGRPKSGPAQGKKTEDGPPWTEPAFSFGNFFSLQIDRSTDDMVSIHPTPLDKDHICGHSGDRFRVPLFWKELIDDGDYPELEEFFNYASFGEKSEMDFQLKNVDGKKRWFHLSAKMLDNEILQLKIVDESKKNRKPGIVFEEDEDEPKLKKIDLVVVNTAYIPNRFAHWKEAFTKLVAEAGLLAAGQQLKFILLKPETSSLKAQDFCQPEICGFFSKPVDRRLFVECIAINLDHKDKEFEKSFLKSLPYARTVEIGRPTTIKQISEFGVIVQNRKPLHPGTLLHLHSSILTGPNEKGTLARCLGFEVDPDDEEKFLIHFLFYGVKDQALKRIRKMIREEYVHKKERKA